ncbi:MAG: Actin- protein 10 [Phylliscum demangeonii]|nr:MAG: Actin- protein 10 [Phylliscum demangeonii]
MAAPSTTTTTRPSPPPPHARPSLVHLQRPTASSPRTPDRAFSSSSFSSPAAGAGPGGGSNSKHDDAAIVLEIRSRFLSAGLSGQSAPQCTLTFSPASQRRAGDYRQWQAGPPPLALAHAQHGRRSTSRRRRPATRIDASELWRPDLRTVDLGLVEDKLDRALRQVLNQHLVTDAKMRRVYVVLGPAVPHAVLGAVLAAVFHVFQSASATLLSAPTCSAVAAGLRSALVVHVGWHETVVTAVYEYRELHTARSVRAGNRLVRETHRRLGRCLERERSHQARPDISLEEVEDVFARLAWVRPAGVDPAAETPAPDPVPVVAIRLQSTQPATTLQLPFDFVARILDAVLFSPAPAAPDAGRPNAAAAAAAAADNDDEALPLGLLVYRALLALPIDARSVCMARIVVVGFGPGAGFAPGALPIPGLPQRIVQELAWLLRERRGWDRVSWPTTMTTKQPEPEPATNDIDNDSHERAAAAAPAPHGFVRAVSSLGAWAGASLLADRKVRGAVEVDRDRFLMHGLRVGAGVGAGAGAAAGAAAAAGPATGTGTGTGVGMGMGMGMGTGLGAPIMMLGADRSSSGTVASSSLGVWA